MYWWRIQPLKPQLATGSVPEREKVKYLIATMALYSIAMESSYFLAEAENTITTIDIVSSALLVILTVLGIFYCYRRNQAGDGRFFLDRFICLGWPVTIRLVTIFILVFGLYAFLGYVIGGSAFEAFFESDSFVEVLFAVAFEIVFYWYLSNHIYDTATHAV